MDQLDFNFKKSRGLGDLLSDYISLFKKIFKHFNANILTLSLPFIALFLLLIFYVTSFITEIINAPDDFSPTLVFSLVIPTMIVLFVFYILVSTFGIEYMFLLAEKGNTDFSTRDIFNRIKKNLTKYISFFFSSIVVSLMLIIPIGIVYALLIFIPLIGTLAMGLISTMIALFFYCALFLYIQGRERLWDSYKASFYLIKSKMWEYGLASYLFQFLAQIILGVLTIIPIVILVIIGFNTVGFDQHFFETFGGKILIAIGGSILTLFMILASIYMISFYVLEYFSLLEVSYSEDTLDQIDQIGTTKDEF